MSTELAIPITLRDGKVISLQLFAENVNTLFQINPHEAEENGESPFQLKEGCFYEYQLPPAYSLETSEVISQSKINKSSGRISPNIYVGTLNVNILNFNHEQCGELSIEVISSKTSYREDYRNMLTDITERCTELLMQATSPVTQKFTTNFYEDSKVLYQRFVFIESIIGSHEFKESIHKLTSSPVVSWAGTEIEKDSRSIKRISNKILKRLLNDTNRMQLPSHHPLKETLGSLPRKLLVHYKRETVDNPENQFIKYALTSFLYFVQNFRVHAAGKSKLNKEASILENDIEQYLSHSMFKEVSNPKTLPLNSPVLQRREGYREVLRTWLMFDLAAKLVWRGGDDVYSGGKKDIALMFEYWVFFKLLDIIKEVFMVESKDIKSLIQETKDGLGLQLKQGKYMPIKGIFESETRKLNIEFSYNRTFSGNNEYPAAGSWTRQLRPDYTLTIWPVGITQQQAELEELITHLHFDAKYKLDEISSLFKGEENLEEEKTEQKKGTYKRADLLKMHTYRDAIRRTAGAYILYPGSEQVTRKGFHELLPGVGAFSLTPSKFNSGSAELIKFLKDVVNHFLNRASQREAMSYRTYDIHRQKNEDSIKYLLPEPFGENRSLIPDETFVLVTFYKNQEHYDWIIKNGLYNARVEDKRGSLRLGPREVSAKYLLLHTLNETITGKLFRIVEHPRIFSKQNLAERDYPSEPTQDIYLVFQIQPVSEKELNGKFWQINTLEGFKKGRGSALPFSASLNELMKVTLKP